MWGTLALGYLTTAVLQFLGAAIRVAISTNDAQLNALGAENVTVPSDFKQDAEHRDQRTVAQVVPDWPQSVKRISTKNAEIGAIPLGGILLVAPLIASGVLHDNVAFIVAAVVALVGALIALGIWRSGVNILTVGGFGVVTLSLVGLMGLTAIACLVVSLATTGTTPMPTPPPSPSPTIT